MLITTYSKNVIIMRKLCIQFVCLMALNGLLCWSVIFTYSLVQFVSEYNLRIFGTPQKRGSGDWSPRGFQGRSPGRGLGTNPVGGMGNEFPQKLTTFLGLKVYFTQHTSIISYFNKVGLLIFPFWTPHFVVWTPHFGWTPRLNYTVVCLPRGERFTS